MQYAAHSIKGPSRAHIVINCAASPRMLDYALPSDEGFPAREGKCAHWVAEQSFLQSTEPHSFIGATLHDVQVDKEMADYVRVFTSYARRRIAEAELKGYKVEFATERRVDLTWIHPDYFGTLDFQIVITGADFCEIIDLKYGFVNVEAKGNPQLVSYAMDPYRHNPGLQNFMLTIVQPRSIHKDGPVRSVVLTRAEMDQWAQHLAYRLALTDDPNAEATPGLHCRFCPALGRCQAAAEKMAHILTLEGLEAFSITPCRLPDVNATKLETLDQVLAYEPVIKKWLEKVREHATHAARSGCRMYTQKLVESYSPRKFCEDDETVIRRLQLVAGVPKEKLVKEVLLTPKQIGESVPKALLRPLLAPLEKNVKLVNVDSAGTAVNVDPYQVFGDPTNGKA